MISLLVVEIIKYTFGVPLVDMVSLISVKTRCMVNYVTPQFQLPASEWDISLATIPSDKGSDIPPTPQTVD